MDPYVSEEEQVEAIKKWFKTNGGSIITGIAIGLAVILGWQYWNSHQLSQAEQASVEFDALSRAAQANDTATATRHAKTLLEGYPDSSYAALASLMLAKFALAEGDDASAIQRLQWVLDNAEQDEILTIARLRLARVLIGEGRLAEAVTQLDKIDNPNFTAELEELRGDVYLARNEPDKARNAYQTARAALGRSSNGAVLDIKLDNLPPPSAQE